MNRRCLNAAETSSRRSAAQRALAKRSARFLAAPALALAGLFAASLPAAAQSPCGDQVRVRPGDTMFSIAERCDTSVLTLRRLNPGVDPQDMPVGLYLHLPHDEARAPDRDRNDRTRPGDRDGVMTVRGTLTREGVECPALRSDNGHLYTLAGNIAPFEPGDRVVVRARRAEISYCQQGVTISVRDIREAGR